jgi:hypothetical protein
MQCSRLPGTRFRRESIEIWPRGGRRNYGRDTIRNSARIPTSFHPISDVAHELRGEYDGVVRLAIPMAKRLDTQRRRDCALGS